MNETYDTQNPEAYWDAITLINAERIKADNERLQQAAKELSLIEKDRATQNKALNKAKSIANKLSRK